MKFQNFKRHFTSSDLPRTKPSLDTKYELKSPESRPSLASARFITFSRRLAKHRSFRKVPPKTATQICYKYLVDAFNCPDVTLTSLQNKQPPLEYFIENIVHYSEASDRYVAGTIVLLDRLREQLPHSLHGLMFSGHLLFLSTFMIVMQQDCKAGAQPFNDEFWSKISGYDVRTVRRFQKRTFTKLDGNVLVLAQDEPILDSLGWSFERLPRPAGVDILPVATDPIPQKPSIEQSSTVAC
ncbi:hypothetical protein M413DRAFT_7456 [Hebeloma cylindrosporum]|uniref:Uncharacterized protein n=1 Tax=Hebeloma cylindrosporum TaxID=76867 RepID=A0A0C3CRJ0_HEBCY|nr:hypothetical protein M413DRAFT_7456 [Hebeloma cylindrosporum h7]